MAPYPFTLFPVKRLDHYIIHSMAIYYRLGKDVGLGLVLSRWERDSEINLIIGTTSHIYLNPRQGIRPLYNRRGGIHYVIKKATFHASPDFFKIMTCICLAGAKNRYKK